MMAAYANAVLSILYNHPLRTHVGFLGGDIVATIAVGWGILWESPTQSSRRHRIAMWLVIWGIVVETFCSISLFAFDEGISQGQQDKIIALEQRLAARHLDEAQFARLKFLMSSHNGQPFQVLPYWNDRESLNLARQIADALVGAHWQLNNPTNTVLITGVVAGVKVEIDKGASPRANIAALALVSELRREDIDATLGEVDIMLMVRSPFLIFSASAPAPPS